MPLHGYGAVGGKSYWSANYAPADALAVAQNAPARTFMHELGHTLLDDQEHRYPDSNFKALTRDATGEDYITDTQIEILRRTIENNPSYLE